MDPVVRFAVRIMPPATDPPGLPAQDPLHSFALGSQTSETFQAVLDRAKRQYKTRYGELLGEEATLQDAMEAEIWLEDIVGSLYSPLTPIDQLVLYIQQPAKCLRDVSSEVHPGKSLGLKRKGADGLEPDNSRAKKRKLDGGQGPLRAMTAKSKSDATGNPHPPNYEPRKKFLSAAEGAFNRPDPEHSILVWDSQPDARGDLTAVDQQLVLNPAARTSTIRKDRPSTSTALSERKSDRIRLRKPRFRQAANQLHSQDGTGMLKPDPIEDKTSSSDAKQQSSVIAAVGIQSQGISDEEKVADLPETRPHPQTPGPAPIPSLTRKSSRKSNKARKSDAETDQAATGRRGVQFWSADEDAMILDSLAKGDSVAAFLQKHNTHRTPKALQHRFRQLKKLPVELAFTSSGKPWTADEDASLLESMRKGDDKTTFHEKHDIHRSIKAVANGRRQLKFEAFGKQPVSSPVALCKDLGQNTPLPGTTRLVTQLGDRWTASERLTLKAGLRDGLDAAEIRAERLQGRSEASIRLKMLSMQGNVNKQEANTGTFPADKLACPNWTLAHSQRLRRAHREGIHPGDEAWLQLFNDVPPEVAEEKMTLYKEQMNTIEDEQDEHAKSKIAAKGETLIPKSAQKRCSNTQPVRENRKDSKSAATSVQRFLNANLSIASHSGRSAGSGSSPAPCRSTDGQRTIKLTRDKGGLKGDHASKRGIDFFKPNQQRGHQARDDSVCPASATTASPPPAQRTPGFNSDETDGPAWDPNSQLTQELEAAISTQNFAETRQQPASELPRDQLLGYVCVPKLPVQSLEDEASVPSKQSSDDEAAVSQNGGVAGALSVSPSKWQDRDKQREEEVPTSQSPKGRFTFPRCQAISASAAPERKSAVGAERRPRRSDSHAAAQASKSKETDAMLSKPEIPTTRQLLAQRRTGSYEFPPSAPTANMAGNVSSRATDGDTVFVKSAPGKLPKIQTPAAERLRRVYGSRRRAPIQRTFFAESLSEDDARRRTDVGGIQSRDEPHDSSAASESNRDTTAKSSIVVQREVQAATSPQDLPSSQSTQDQCPESSLVGSVMDVRNMADVPVAVSRAAQDHTVSVSPVAQQPAPVAYRKPVIELPYPQIFGKPDSNSQVEAGRPGFTFKVHKGIVDFDSMLSKIKRSHKADPKRIIERLFQDAKLVSQRLVAVSAEDYGMIQDLKRLERRRRRTRQAEDGLPPSRSSRRDPNEMPPSDEGASSDEWENHDLDEGVLKLHPPLNEDESDQDIDDTVDRARHVSEVDSSDSEDQSGALSGGPNQARHPSEQSVTTSPILKAAEANPNPMEIGESRANAESRNTETNSSPDHNPGPSKSEHTEGDDDLRQPQNRSLVSPADGRVPEPILIESEVDSDEHDDDGDDEGELPVALSARSDAENVPVPTNRELQDLVQIGDSHENDIADRQGSSQVQSSRSSSPMSYDEPSHDKAGEETAPSNGITADEAEGQHSPMSQARAAPSKAADTLSDSDSSSQSSEMSTADEAEGQHSPVSQARTAPSKAADTLSDSDSSSQSSEMSSSVSPEERPRVAEPTESEPRDICIDAGASDDAPRSAQIAVMTDHLPHQDRRPPSSSEVVFQGSRHMGLHRESQTRVEETLPTPTTAPESPNVKQTTEDMTVSAKSIQAQIEHKMPERAKAIVPVPNASRGRKSKNARQNLSLPSASSNVSGTGHVQQTADSSRPPRPPKRKLTRRNKSKHRQSLPVQENKDLQEGIAGHGGDHSRKIQATATGSQRSPSNKLQSVPLQKRVPHPKGRPTKVQGTIMRSRVSPSRKIQAAPLLQRTSHPGGSSSKAQSTATSSQVSASQLVPSAPLQEQASLPTGKTSIPAKPGTQAHDKTSPPAKSRQSGSCAPSAPEADRGGLRAMMDFKAHIPSPPRARPAAPTTVGRLTAFPMLGGSDDESDDESDSSA